MIVLGPSNTNEARKMVLRQSFFMLVYTRSNNNQQEGPQGHAPLEERPATFPL